MALTLYRQDATPQSSSTASAESLRVGKQHTRCMQYMELQAAVRRTNTTPMPRGSACRLFARSDNWHCGCIFRTVAEEETLLIRTCIRLDTITHTFCCRHEPSFRQTTHISMRRRDNLVRFISPRVSHEQIYERAFSFNVTRTRRAQPRSTRQRYGSPMLTCWQPCVGRLVAFRKPNGRMRALVVVDVFRLFVTRSLLPPGGDICDAG